MAEPANNLIARSLMFLAFASASANAQFTIDGRPVQVHGFVTQGFAYSDANNYLTMDTSKGTFAFTDAGLNVSSQVLDRLHVGGQIYVRNVGELGRGHVTLDWASGDYHLKDWLSVRAGKIKTVFGLYNDTQDEEFLHTWALLPQSIYPLDIRESSLAHLGGDLYGTIPVRKLGQFTYTAYAGTLGFDRTGGYVLAFREQGAAGHKFSGSAKGADFRWTTPVPGLLVGASFLSSPTDLRGTTVPSNKPFDADQVKVNRQMYYGQYIRGNLRFEAEYNRYIEKLEFQDILGPFGPPHIEAEYDRRAWYTAFAYRLSKRLELGEYTTRFFPNANKIVSPLGVPLAPAARHVFDQVVAARVDLNKYFDLKLEAHFIDGYGDVLAAHGFYTLDNPGQLKPKTNLLIGRLGFNF